MKVILELAADVCLDIAMVILLLNVIRNNGTPMPSARLIAATFAVGFAISTIASGVRGMSAFIIPDVLGFHLAYTAFLFTFPGRQAENGAVGKRQVGGSHS